jgi:hypothetical protein
VISLVLGVIQPALPGITLWPTYLHLLVLGWLTQLIFGVARWMFPRDRSTTTPSGERLGWATYISLNAGLVLRSIAEPGPASRWRSGLLLLSALLQVAAGWLFVLTTWPRVRGR